MCPLHPLFYDSGIQLIGKNLSRNCPQRGKKPPYTRPCHFPGVVVVTSNVQWPFGWGEWYTEWDNSEGPSQLSVGCWHLRGAVSVPLLPLSNAGSLTPSQMLLWVRFSINYLPANPPLRVWILGKPYLRQSLKLRKGVMEHSWKGFFWEQECINEDRHESVPQLGRILSWIKKHCYPNYS